MSLALKNTLHRLEEYKDLSFPIFSVYLPLPQQNNITNEILLKQFNHLIAHQLAARELDTIEKDFEYIRGFLEAYKNINGDRTLIFFSGGDKIWEVIHSAEKLAELAHVGHSPFLEPLKNKLQDDCRYLIILADREKARIFTFHAGVIEEALGIFDPSVPQNVKANEERYYGRTDKISRHIQDHLHRHFNLISDQLNKFVHNKHISGVVIGGHKELMHTFEKQLPKHLQEKIMGEFVSELNVSVNEIIDKSKTVIKNVDKTFNFYPVLRAAT